MLLPLPLTNTVFPAPARRTLLPPPPLMTPVPAPPVSTSLYGVPMRFSKTPCSDRVLPQGAIDWACPPLSPRFSEMPAVSPEKSSVLVPPESTRARLAGLEDERVVIVGGSAVELDVLHAGEVDGQTVNRKRRAVQVERVGDIRSADDQRIGGIAGAGGEGHAQGQSEAAAVGEIDGELVGLVGRANDLQLRYRA